MKEFEPEILESIYFNEALERISEFREIPPTRKPNLAEYISYLNKIERRLENSKFRRSGNGEIVFYLPGKRLNEMVFSPQSIVWVWETRSGERKSVRFFTSSNGGNVELELSKLRKNVIDPSTTLTIIIGDEESALVTRAGVQTVMPLDKAIPLFPKPKR